MQNLAAASGHLYLACMHQYKCAQVAIDRCARLAVATSHRTGTRHRTKTQITGRWVPAMGTHSKGPGHGLKFRGREQPAATDRAGGGASDPVRAFRRPVIEPSGDAGVIAPVLAARVVFENDYICFLTYDDEHHRLAIVNVPGLHAADAESWGLAHLAYSYKTLRQLLSTYRRLEG